MSGVKAKKAANVPVKLSLCRKKLCVMWSGGDRQLQHALHHALHYVLPQKNTKFSLTICIQSLHQVLHQVLHLTKFESCLASDRLLPLCTLSPTRIKAMSEIHGSTWKGLQHRAMHRRSLRKVRSLLRVNCGAMIRVYLNCVWTKGRICSKLKGSLNFIHMIVTLP